MSKRRGMAFVVTLAVLAGLVSLLAILAASQRWTLRAQSNLSESRRAALMAEAGIQRALAEFANQNPNLITLQDNWALLGNGTNDVLFVGRDSFRVQIIDAASYININTAPREQLERLPLTSEQIDSLLDWREPELQPRVEGAKDSFYNNLSNPYNAKLAPFDSVDELLLVRGFTPATLYDIQENFSSTVTLVPGSIEDQPILTELLTVDSVSADVASTAGAKLNVNNATQPQLLAVGLPPNVVNSIVNVRNFQGTFSSLGEVLRVPGVNLDNAATIIDRLTVSDAPVQIGRININTASEAVLNSLPAMQPDVTSAILSRQSAGFSRLAELTQIPGYDLELLASTIDLLSVNSQRFIVRSVGTAGNTEVAMTAVVALEGTDARVIKRITPPFLDMRERWGWTEEPNNEVILWEEAS